MTTEVVPPPWARVSFGAASVAGPCRDRNEDACLARPATDAGFPAHLFAVADGLGGHAAGDVASRLVVTALERHVGHGRGDRPERWMKQALRAANLAIHDYAQENPTTADLQSTATALLVEEQHAVVGHVGDCRAYLVREGAIELCTTDHTRAMEMLRLRLITPEQAVGHPARSILTRSLGAELMVNIDVTRRPLRAGDVYVLCSDGLWSEVSRAEILEIVEGGAGDAAASRLVRLAEERGAADNVSAVVVRVDGPGDATPARPRRWFSRR